MNKEAIFLHVFFQSLIARKILLFLFLLGFCFSAFAQISDSISFPIDTIVSTKSKSLLKESPITQVDSQRVEKKGFFKKIFKSGKLKRYWQEDYPSPKKAIRIALVAPGAGQIYNKQYWKLPIVYGSYTGLVLLIIDNRKKYRQFRDNYIYALDDDPDTNVEPALSFLDAPALRKNRDAARKNLELSWVGLVGIHLLQTADAFVFAHLRSFDVNDDLSLHIDPRVNIDALYQTNVGLSFTLRTKPTKKESPILFYTP